MLEIHLINRVFIVTFTFIREIINEIINLSLISKLTRFVNTAIYLSMQFLIFCIFPCSEQIF